MLQMILVYKIIFEMLHSTAFTCTLILLLKIKTFQQSIDK